MSVIDEAMEALPNDLLLAAYVGVVLQYNALSANNIKRWLESNEVDKLTPEAIVKLKQTAGPGKFEGEPEMSEQREKLRVAVIERMLNGRPDQPLPASGERASA
jgi:hypothetical protein